MWEGGGGGGLPSLRAAAAMEPSGGSIRERPEGPQLATEVQRQDVATEVGVCAPWRSVCLGPCSPGVGGAGRY